MPRAPWSAVPAARSTAPVLKIRLALVLGSLLLAASMGVFATFAWMSAPKNQATASAPVPLAAAFSQAAANDYLRGQSSSLPAISIDKSGTTVTHSSAASPSYWPTAPLFPTYTLANSPDAFATYANVPCPYFATNGATCTLEVHKYLVDTPSGLYALYVSVDITHPTNPVLAAAPSLLPLRFDHTHSQFSFLTGTSTPVGALRGAGTNSYVNTAISNWAKAFVVADPAALNDLVHSQGQNNAQPNPLSLRGFNYAGGGPVGAFLSSALPNNTIVVQVSLLVSPTSAKGVVVRSDYDLVVSDDSGTSAYVSNWGPAGSGSFLN